VWRIFREEIKPVLIVRVNLTADNVVLSKHYIPIVDVLAPNFARVHVV